MKKSLNILSIIDLSVLAVWCIALAVARFTAETEYAERIAAVFVIIYAIAAITVLAYTVASIILLIKKKKSSLPLLIFTYIMNAGWVAIVFMVIDYAAEYISKLV